MDELVQIEHEYGSPNYFKSLEIIRVDDEEETAYSIIQNSSYILLETLESVVFHVFVSINGWYAKNIKNATKSQLGPTFESVAKEISPQFSKRWNEELFKRLSMHQDDAEDSIDDASSINSN